MARRRQHKGHDETAVALAVVIMAVSIISAGFFVTLAYSFHLGPGGGGGIVITCTGNVQSQVSPNPAVNGTPVTGTVTGLSSGCQGKTAKIFKGNACPGVSLSGPCDGFNIISGSGSCNFTAPSPPGDYFIVGCVDKNGDNDFADSGENSIANKLTTYSPVCGNGAVESGETCDDGNTAGGDGCSSTCQAEPVCGNGVIEADEQCDDGNVADGDGCSATCQTEVAAPVCGDGVCDTGENSTSCAIDCAAPPTAQCGNDIAEAGEECDGSDLGAATCTNQGFTGGTLSCSSGCTLDTSACTTAPSGPTEADAQAAIDQARTDISAAQAAGKDVAQASSQLTDAIAAFDDGDYSTAKTKAEGASLAAQLATQRPAEGPSVALLGVALVILIVGAGAAYYLLKVRKVKVSIPGFSPPPGPAQE